MEHSMDKDLLIKLQKDLNVYMVDHVDIGPQRMFAYDKPATRNNEEGVVDDKFMENLNSYLKNKDRNAPTLTKEEFEQGNKLAELAENLHISTSADRSFKENHDKFPEAIDRLQSEIKNAEISYIVKSSILATVGNQLINGTPDLGQIEITTKAVENFIKLEENYYHGQKLNEEAKKELLLSDNPIATEYKKLKVTFEKLRDADDDKMFDAVDKFTEYEREIFNPEVIKLRDEKLKAGNIDPATILNESPKFMEVYTKTFDEIVEEKQKSKQEKEPSSPDKNDNRSAHRSPELNELLQAVKGLSESNSIASNADRGQIGNLTENSYNAGVKKVSDLELGA
jgi:hypothetical protein